MMFDVKILVFTGLCLASFPALSTEQWQVSGVESWDTLNMRSRPGVASEVIGKIPFDAVNISATEEKEQRIGKTVWKQIEWDGLQGWVSKAYLATMPEEPETAADEADSELAAGIVVMDEPAGETAKAEKLMADTAPDKPQQKTSKPAAMVVEAGSDVASDGMTDLEALSILARPAIADSDPVEEQAVRVVPASLKILKEE